MSMWFEGTGQIGCDLQQVQDAVKNLGEHWAAVTSLMPGMTSVALVDEGNDFVTIRTNEGLMKRTNIDRRVEVDSVIVEFDEEYRAGRMVTTESHFFDEFRANDGGVEHRMVISGVEARGLLGFFYRHFGKRNTGKAFLEGYKAYFEQL